MASPPKRFLLIFTLIWSTMVLAFDTFIATTIFYQTRSLFYSATEGRILDSAVTTESTSDGTTYHAAITYEFHVDGRRHQSDRVRYGQGGDSAGGWARETVRDNPPGAIRSVFYDPAAPAHSVLQTGIGRQDWFLTLFMTPFNVAMIFLWTMVRDSRRPAPPAGGAVIQTETDRILVQFHPLPPFGGPLLALGGVTFASIFLLGLPFGFTPDPRLVWVAWIVAVALAFRAARKRHANRVTPDLIIDAAQGRLDIPGQKTGVVTKLTEWRRHRDIPALSIPLEHVRAVTVNERNRPGNEHDHSVSVVTLDVSETDMSPKTEYDIAEWPFPDRAESFAAWLGETLNLPAGPFDKPPHASTTRLR